MRLFSVAFLLGILIFVMGCSQKPRVAKNWEKAKLGMAKAEIEELFGEPNEVSETTGQTNVAGLVAAGLFGMDILAVDYWSYAPPNYQEIELSPKEKEEQDARWAEQLDSMSEEELNRIMEVFASALFSGSSGPSDEAFAIFFDRKGNVVGLRGPVIGEYSGYASSGDTRHTTKSE